MNSYVWMIEWGSIRTPECIVFFFAKSGIVHFKEYCLNERPFSVSSPQKRLSSPVPYPNSPFLLSLARPPLSLFPLFFLWPEGCQRELHRRQLTSGMPRRPGISSRPVASFIAELGPWRAPMISPFDAESFSIRCRCGVRSCCATGLSAPLCCTFRDFGFA